MLHLKRSLDVKRQRATWELGILLHQNESKAATLITSAKAIYSQLALEGKINCRAAVREAKAARDHGRLAAKVACSQAIGDAEAWKASQALVLQQEHSKYLQTLEEQDFEEESKSHHEVLSSCWAILSHSPSELRGPLASSYHLLLGQRPPLPPLILPPRTPHGRTAILSCSSHTDAQTVSKTEKQLPSPEPMGDMPLGGATLVVTSGGPPNPKK